MLEENLIRQYQESFREHHDLLALSDYFKQESFTYLQLSQEIAKLHLLFQEAQLQPGDKVALIGRNNIRWCVTYLATITYGAVIVPILQDFNPNDVHHIINHSDSVLLFSGDTYWDAIEVETIGQVRGAFSLTDFRCLYQALGTNLKGYQDNIETHFQLRYPHGFTPKDILFAEVPNERVMVLSYTSGTTGFSKGVMQTVNNHTGNVKLGISQNIHYRGSRALSFLPLAHSYGCAFDFLLPMATGSHVTLLGKIPSPKLLIEAMAAVRPTLICMVPLIMEKIYKSQIKPTLEKAMVKFALKVPLLDAKIYDAVQKRLIEVFGGEFNQVIIGGAPLNSEVEEFLVKINFPFTVGYGMTECSPLISYTSHEYFVPRSCGRVLDGLMEAKIDSPDPENKAGEICVRGEHLMAGYYKNPEATAEVIDAQGWLHTGDIGTMTEDRTLSIRGRSKSMILSASGQNIYPEEIESKLNNMPCVQESLVVERGGKLVALIYPDYDRCDVMELTQPQIQKIMQEHKERLNSELASYERISAIELYPEEFKKTPKRSIKRYLYNV